MVSSSLVDLVLSDSAPVKVTRTLVPGLSTLSGYKLDQKRRARGDRLGVFDVPCVYDGALLDALKCINYAAAYTIFL